MSILAETICECAHRKKFHNEWEQCSKCVCSGFHWMDATRRAKIELEVNKVGKKRKKGSKKKTSPKDTAIAILAMIGMYGGIYVGIPFLLKSLFGD